MLRDPRFRVIVRLFIVATLAAGLIHPASRSWLEARMSTHMLVQMPLLMLLGILAARVLPIKMQHAIRHHTGGVLPLALLACFTASYWMIPRAVDSTLSQPAYEMAKFLSLPLLAGLPLALAWSQLGVTGRGFLWANGISMLPVVGWLYLAAPARLCNQYLITDQSRTGQGMIAGAGLLLVIWLAGFFRKTVPRGSNQ